MTKPKHGVVIYDELQTRKKNFDIQKVDTQDHPHNFVSILSDSVQKFNARVNN